MIFVGMLVERICLLYVAGVAMAQNIRKIKPSFIYIFLFAGFIC